MLPNFDDIPTADIDHRASNTLCGVDDYVVILGHVKCVQGLDLFPRSVKHTFINRIRHAVINEFRQYQPIFTIVKHLKGISRKWQPVPDIWISSQHGVDVSCEFRPLILVDCVCDIRRRTLDLYPSSNAALRLMTRCRGRSTTFGSTAQASNSAAWDTVLGCRCLLATDLEDEL